MKKQYVFILLVLSSFFATLQAQTTRYVTEGGAGTKDGTSWTNASDDIQAMMNASTTNDAIWVAKGTYKPNRPADNLTTISVNNRDNAFVLKADVKIYGGFAGTETTLADRDLSITANKTILSGDFNNDDTVSGYGNTLSITNNTENATHIVISAGDVGTARLDGFIITGGNFDNTNYDKTINGQNLQSSVGGGGMLNQKSSPIIANCSFIGNVAKYNIVTDNGYGGGGMLNVEADPTIINCLFTQNKFILPISNTDIGGGGMSNYQSSPTIVNSTFFGNSTDNHYSSGFELLYNSGSIKIYNSIVWGYHGGKEGIARLNSPTSDIQYSLRPVNDTANGNINATSLTDTDIFNDPANGDFSLKTGSVAINAGSNTLYTNAGGILTTDKDFAGNKRVFNDTIDIGAYESQVAIPTPDANNILYVNKSATGEGSGNSWANAIPELADALVWANKNKANFTTTPLQIWVAKGTYKPMYSPEDGANFGTNQTRDNAFLMVNNVQLYGGFAGTETLLTDRDLSLSANKTTLSGDLGTQDIVTGSSSTLSITENDTNTYHVIISAGEVSTARLDGFTISGGNANDSTYSFIVVNGNNVGRVNGGGVHTVLSSPIISNAIVTGNVGFYGGGIYNSNSSASTIINSLIVKNKSMQYGGGICNGEANALKIINTTIIGNNASTSGHGIYNVYLKEPMVSNNSIVLDVVINASGGSYAAKNSIIKGSSDTTNGNIDATGLKDTDIFNNPANGDYSLNAFSPAINAGDNTLYTGTIATDKDLVGNARLFAGIPDPDVIDLGAYEYQAEPLIIIPTDNIVYVNKNVSGGNKTGDSWANAIPELADALVWANKNKANFTTTPLQIWVAKGTYKPKYTPEDGKNFTVGTDAKDNAFLMVKNVQLYGGFAGTETSLTDRDLSLTANKTTLSGDFNDDDSVSGSASTLSIGNNTDNAYHIVISADDVGTARLDGFTITGANASGSGTILVNTKSFLRNYGGGMYLDASSPTIENSTFINNYSSDYGSGIFNNHSSSPKVTASVFKENKVGSCGAAIYNYNSSKPVITSSFFTGNNAHQYGGAIYDSASSESKIINSTIVGNSATAAGAGIYVHTSTTSIQNSIVWNEIATYGTGSYTIKKTILQGKLYDQSGTETTTGLTQENIFKDSNNGDYSLNPSVLNPAINGGDNTLYTGTIATDKDVVGNARLFDGVAATDVIDLGAYEYQAEPTPKAPTGQTVQIYAGAKTVSDLQITGTAIKWYDSATAGTGTLLDNTTVLIDNTIYFASQTVNGVESTDRLAVATKKISEASQTFNASDNPTVANLVATPTTGTTVKWFTTATGGTALTNTDALSSGTYYVEQNTPLTIVTLGSGFSRSFRVAVQADGKILIADTSNNAIKRMNADGSNIELLGSGFSNPIAVVVESDGKILVADSGNNAIKRMDADGTNIVNLGSGFNQPYDVAVQPDGKILVADAGNKTIKRMDADGTNIQTLGSGFSYPYGVSIQSDGKILIADTLNNAIKRMDADGTNIQTLGSGFSSPSKVITQSDGKILVADSGNNAIKRMDADGTNIEILGSGFYDPTGIAFQSDGKILVADRLHNAIKRITEATISNRVAVTVVVKATPTITFADFTKTYGDAAFDLTATSTSSETVTYSVVVGGTGEVNLSGKNITLVNAGTVTLKASVAENATYEAAEKTITLTINKAELTVTADNKSRVYGDANPTFTFAYSGFKNSDDASDLITPLTTSTTATQTSNIGDYDIVVSFNYSKSAGAPDNYSYKFVKGTLAITKAELTVTADNKSRVYGDANPTFTFAYSGFKNSDDASDLTAPLTTSTTATQTSNIGDYDIVVSFNYSKSAGAPDNYSYKFVKGTLAITKSELTVTADNKSRVYGDANPTFTFAYSGFKNSDDASDLTAPLTTSTTATQTSNIGDYDIVVSFNYSKSAGAPDNYSYKFVKGTLAITKAELTVTADNKSRVYGDANPTFTVSYSGFKNGESATDLTTVPTASTIAILTSDAGTYDIEVSGGAATNYTFVYAKGTLSITKASQTITFNAVTHNDKDVFDLTATSTSGLAITYTSSDTNVATISGNTVTVLSAGVTTITAKQVGNNNYKAASEVAQVLTIVTLGVDDDIVLSEVIKLYPNPAVNFIKVDLGTIEKASIKIFDINGKLVLDKKNYNSKEVLNISNLNIGVYFVKIESDKGNIMKKFIKKE